MTGAVVVGQNVILRPDSVFAGKSPNPPSGVVGEVLSFDNEWVDIHFLNERQLTNHFGYLQ